MRRRGLGAILLFHALLATVLALGIASSMWTIGFVPVGEFRGVAVVAGAAAFSLIYAVAAYRAVLAACPLRPGEIAGNPGQAFAYDMHLLFDLMVFGPVLSSRLLPIPVADLLYRGLGARMGRNSHTAGLICDPMFVSVGDNTILGQDSLVVPHVLEGERLAHDPIRIGSNVTVGARAVVLSGVTIGDGAIVGTGAVVTKGTQIGPNEVWGGVPARLIRRNDVTAANSTRAA